MSSKLRWTRLCPVTLVIVRHRLRRQPERGLYLPADRGLRRLDHDPGRDLLVQAPRGGAELHHHQLRRDPQHAHHHEH